MEIYLVGKVITIGKTYIIFESHFCGVVIYVLFPNFFTLNKIQKIYILKYQKNGREFLYGFKSFKERSLFASLINIGLISPKMAFNLLKVGFEKAIKLIINSNTGDIAKISLWSDKSAKQICLELADKYSRWYNNLLIKNFDNNSRNCQEVLSSENTQKNFNKYNNHSDF